MLYLNKYIAYYHTYFYFDRQTFDKYFLTLGLGLFYKAHNILINYNVINGFRVANLCLQCPRSG